MNLSPSHREVTGNVQPRISAKQMYALFVLVGINAAHFMDDWVLSIIVEPVKAEFELSDGEVGMLYGMAFAVPYILSGLVFATVIDRCNRRNLLATIVICWSTLTAICGLAVSYTMLFVARMGVGAATGGSSPTALSMIADIFPRDRRATAVGVFYIAGPLGYTASVLLGGAATAHWGWRAAFMLASVPGICFALLALTTMKEPPRGQHDEASTEAIPEPIGLRNAWQHVVTNRGMLSLGLAALLLAASHSAILGWMPSLLIREHHFTVATGGIAMGPISGIAGVIAMAVSGWLSDRLAFRDRRWPMWLAALSAVATLTLGVLMISIAGDSSMLTVMFAYFFAAGLYIGPLYGAWLNHAPPHNRAAVIALLIIVITLMGGVGPYMGGLLSDAFGGPHSLRAALSSLLSLNAISAGLILYAARKEFGLT